MICMRAGENGPNERPIDRRFTSVLKIFGWTAMANGHLLLGWAAKNFWYRFGEKDPMGLWKTFDSTVNVPVVSIKRVRAERIKHFVKQLFINRMHLFYHFNYHYYPVDWYGTLQVHWIFHNSHFVGGVRKLECSRFIFAVLLESNLHNWIVFYKFLTSQGRAT